MQFYESLIPRHLHDLALFPGYLTEHFKKGIFSILLSKRDWCGIALDKCHEMKINKDAKLAVIRPTSERMTSIANYLPFRAKCVNNLKSQILPQNERNITCYTVTTRDRATTEHVKTMLAVINSTGMYENEQSNRGLWKRKKLQMNKHMICLTSDPSAKNHMSFMLRTGCSKK